MGTGAVGHSGDAAGREILALDDFAALLASPPEAPEASRRAHFVGPSPGEEARFAAMCAAHGLVALDPLERQLADLAAVRFPAAADGERRRRFIAEQLEAAGGAASYGAWAYFAWARTLVHLLPEDAYFEVITNRNRDKITLEEQRRLRGKRVGVIGLSVGAEAAVAVAQEHLCGEIVLADFDRLDLSNLNRLHAGCDELGLPKTTIAARRIARIDPWLRVTLYDDGVDEGNIERFLDGLDLLIEECDGLGMKFDVRRLAKARGLDIVYAADERGFLSVEPYATHPELSPFHGLVAARPAARESFPTPLAFMKALAEWLGGWSGITARSRASLEQLGGALCGYPQLASEARFAAGQIGHVARRLLLREPLAPWVGQLDLEAILPLSPGRAGV
jgi:hypothetical protein